MKVSDRIKLKKSRMMRVCLPLLLVLLLFSGAAGKEVDPYELLGSSVSVFMMLPNDGLNTYMASLQFQGALYNDVKQEIERNFKVQPEFEDGWVRDMWSFRETYAQPVPEVDHSHLVPPLQTPIIPNLYWACMHHVYPWDRGTNFAVDLGQRITRAMA